MMKVLSQKTKIISIITVIFVLFILWFSWMSMITAKTNFMENKVKAGLSIGIQVVERDAPRIKIINDGGYYIPDVNGNSPSNVPLNSPRQEAYAVLLETLNQDVSTPLSKVSSVGLDSTSELNAQAMVQFDVFPGITKSIVVRESMLLPHFKNATGDALVN